VSDSKLLALHHVEPEPANLAPGKTNFGINDYASEFVKTFPGPNDFELDKFTPQRGLDTLDLLYAAIQGYEIEMLKGEQPFSWPTKRIFIHIHS
jgi:hypothetical protein